MLLADIWSHCICLPHRVAVKLLEVCISVADAMSYLSSKKWVVHARTRVCVCVRVPLLVYERRQDAAMLTCTAVLLVLLALVLLLLTTRLSLFSIVHRDLACRNLLVGDTIATVKISDYGMARFLNDTDYYRMVRACQLTPCTR